ncbi:MAG: hypothetical protein KDC95_09875 [Planctomycetes bacterium]|nr:hypothetical protein [Planctomycetota bacterium]
MTIAYSMFERLKRLVSFDDSDVENLRSLAPAIMEIGPSLTDAFYSALASEPATAEVIDGRLEKLQKTHSQWLRELIAGDYGERYFTSRIRIGQVHVVHGIEPAFVEAVMSIIRTRAIKLLAEKFDGTADLAEKAASFIKICDLDMLLINMAYADERLERLSSFTGMKRTLIENIIRIPPDTEPARQAF